MADEESKKQLQIRKILGRIASSTANDKKRSRDQRQEDLENPLIMYLRALIIPYKNSNRKPIIPFEILAQNEEEAVYDVTGNGYTKLFIHKKTYKYELQ